MISKAHIFSLLRYAIIGLMALVAMIGAIWSFQGFMLPSRIEAGIAAQVARARGMPIPPSKPAERLPPALHPLVDEARQPARGAVARISGRIKLPGTDVWRNFEGSEFVSAVEPIFEWNIRLDIAPGLWVHVVDRYQDGRGQISSKAFGLISLIDERTRDELALTQLVRWSGLAVMAPDALARLPHIDWKERDAGSASLQVTDRALSGAHRFYFDAAGHIARTESTDRFERYPDGIYRRTGSIMHRSDYRMVDGVSVPQAFSIIRIEPDGRPVEFLTGRYSDIRIIR